MSKKTAPEHAKDAAKHHTTLSTFSLCVSLLEGGSVYDHTSYRATSKIIALCKAEQQRQLSKYDAALSKAAHAAATIASPAAGSPRHFNR